MTGGPFLLTCKGLIPILDPPESELFQINVSAVINDLGRFVIRFPGEEVFNE